MPSSSSEVAPVRKLWWVILVAISAAAVANVLFYYLVTGIMGEPLLVPEQYPPSETARLPVQDVILFSIIFSLGACTVFVLIAYLAKRPIRTYVIVALVVLTMLNFLPFKMPTPPVSLATKLTLVMMHVIGAVVVVGTLVTLGRRRE